VQTLLHHLESVRMVDVLILVSHCTTRSRAAGRDGSRDHLCITTSQNTCYQEQARHQNPTLHYPFLQRERMYASSNKPASEAAYLLHTLACIQRQLATAGRTPWTYSPRRDRARRRARTKAIARSKSADMRQPPTMVSIRTSGHGPQNWLQHRSLVVCHVHRRNLLDAAYDLFMR
jgi:hypothetical protein